MIRHDESHGMRVAQPNLVALYQIENFLVANSVLVADDKELLLVLDQLLNVFAEERKWRIGDDDIRLLEQSDAFITAKIAVAL